VPVEDVLGSVKTTFEGEEAKILSVETKLEVGLKGLEYSSHVQTVCTAKIYAVDGSSEPTLHVEVAMLLVFGQLLYSIFGISVVEELALKSIL
jgi:hypothetical protein